MRSEPCREVASIMDGKIEFTRIKKETAGKERIQRVIGKQCSENSCMRAILLKATVGEMIPLIKSA